MIDMIVGGALNAVGNVLGGISASKAIAKAKKNVKAQQQKNEAWYNRRYNEDSTQRADAQRMIAQTQEALKRRAAESAATAAVMGSTEESVAADKAANAQAMADMASQIAAQGAARQDQVEQQYQQRAQALDDKLADLDMQKGNLGIAGLF